MKFTAYFALLAGMVVFFGASGRIMAEEKSAAPVVGLVETSPVLDFGRFTGRYAQAYKTAAEIPKTLDKLYCYCKCKESETLKHKTLLTCFTTDHATKCEICTREAEIAGEMTKAGKSFDEIRMAVNQYGEKAAKEKEEKDKESKKNEHHHN